MNEENPMETAQEDVRFDETPTEGDQLGGYNTKPADPIDVDDEFGGAPSAEGGDDEQDDAGAGDQPDPIGEPEPAEPEPAPDPPAAAKKSNSRSGKKKGDKEKGAGGAPIRTYIVFEEFELEPNGKGYQEVHRVEARNSENAIRKAYKELAGDKDEASATLVVVPESMWRPTPVHLRPKTTVSVSIG
jgi:hypothetical protein